MKCDISGFGFTGNWCDWSWNWTLREPSSWAFHAAVWILYGVTVKVLQIWVASHEKYTPPAWLEPLKKVHNVSMSLLSTVMGGCLLYVVILDGRLSSWHGMACQMTPNIGLYGLMNFVFVASKIWEWIDTYLLILSDKPVIFLHYFHHMTTFSIMAVTHNFPGGGFCLINCFIHTVMYLHYAYPVRWARIFITTTQLAQFAYMMSIHVYALLNPITCFDMSPVMIEWVFCQAIVTCLFFMFGSFFVQEYVSKKPKSSREKKIKKVE